MDPLNEKVAKVLGEDYTREALKRDRAIILDLKKKNIELKKDVKLLARNNKTMEELISVLETRVQKLKESLDFSEKHIYSFERGGWVEKGSADRRKTKIKSVKKLSVADINRQLEEILRLLKLHKRKLK